MGIRYYIVVGRMLVRPMAVTSSAHAHKDQLESGPSGKQYPVKGFPEVLVEYGVYDRV